MRAAVAKHPRVIFVPIDLARFHAQHDGSKGGYVRPVIGWTSDKKKMKAKFIGHNEVQP